MSARMELHVALSLRLDAIVAHRLANAYRAEVLNEGADELVAFCPNHGNRDTSFIDCHCPAADDLRRMADARRDTAPRCENPKCGRPITRGAQWCSTWCHQASDAQAGKDTASSGESTQPANEPHEHQYKDFGPHAGSRCITCNRPWFLDGSGKATDGGDAR